MGVKITYSGSYSLKKILFEHALIGVDMVKMKLKIKNDSNKLRYISIIRQNCNASIDKIKKDIEKILY